jgi:hypothetical protein
VTLPAPAIVPAGENSATFAVTAGMSAGVATVTASAGGAEVSVEIALIEAPPIGLLLVEVFYNPSGSDGGQEWVKLYNGNGVAVDLAGYSLSWRGTAFSSGDGGGTLQLAGTIGPGACFLIGGPTVNSGVSICDQVNDFSPDIQNGGTPADDALDAVSLTTRSQRGQRAHHRSTSSPGAGEQQPCMGRRGGARRGQRAGRQRPVGASPGSRDVGGGDAFG